MALSPSSSGALCGLCTDPINPGAVACRACGAVRIRIREPGVLRTIAGGFLYLVVLSSSCSGLIFMGNEKAPDGLGAFLILVAVVAGLLAWYLGTRGGKVVWRKSI